MPEHFVLVDRDEVVEGSSGSAEASDEEPAEAGHGHDVVALLQPNMIKGFYFLQARQAMEGLIRLFCSLISF